MSDSTMDWIWSKYTISPDPASGMQSLYQTCSALSKHVLTPSDIVLSGGGFTLRPELAAILTDAVPPLGQLLDLAMQDSGLPGFHDFCQAELQVLTGTTGLVIATQNQVVWNWIHVIEKLYVARVDLKSLRFGRPIHVLGRERPSQMRETVMALPPSLRIKLPPDFLRSHGVLVSPLVRSTSDTARYQVRKSERPPSRPPLDRADAGGLASSRPATGAHLIAAPSDIHQSTHEPRAVPHDPLPEPSSQQVVLMADLVLAYDHASNPGGSLSSRAGRIISKKSLSSSDITDHPYPGIFRMEPHLFRSTESTVLEMQRLLTSAFSFVQGRPICFVVDPHGILLEMLRSAGSVYELQVAWKDLWERMEIAQRSFIEYQADCVAQSALPTKFHAACELPVSTRKSSVCVGTNDEGGQQPEGLEDPVNRAECAAGLRSPTGHAPASVSVSSSCSGSTRAEGSRRPGKRGVSVQASAPAVIRQAPTSETASPLAVMDFAEADIRSSHALEAELDGPVIWSKSRPRDNATLSAYTPVNTVPRAPPAPTVVAKEISPIPAANRVTNPQAQIAHGLVPAAAGFAAVKDPPCDSLCAMLFASARESDHPATAENEGGQGRGMDEDLRERESSARDCAPEFQRKPLHVHSGALPESRVSELVTRFEAMISSMPRSLPSGAFMTCTSPGARVLSSASASTAEATQSRASDKCTSSPLPALATCRSRGARTPPSASTGTANGEQLPASDLELQKIGINLEAEFGVQAEEQSERIFIGSAEHKVLLPPPAPVLAYGERAVKLGGRMIGQQNFSSNAGSCTFAEAMNGSIRGPAYSSTVTSRVPLRQLPVFSSVTTSTASILLSTSAPASTTSAPSRASAPGTDEHEGLKGIHEEFVNSDGAGTLTVHPLACSCRKGLPRARASLIESSPVLFQACLHECLAPSTVELGGLNATSPHGTVDSGRRSNETDEQGIVSKGEEVRTSQLPAPPPWSPSLAFAPPAQRPLQRLMPSTLCPSVKALVGDIEGAVSLPLRSTSPAPASSFEGGPVELGGQDKTQHHADPNEDKVLTPDVFATDVSATNAPAAISTAPASRVLVCVGKILNQNGARKHRGLEDPAKRADDLQSLTGHAIASRVLDPPLSSTYKHPGALDARAEASALAVGRRSAETASHVLVDTAAITTRECIPLVAHKLSTTSRLTGLPFARASPTIAEQASARTAVKDLTPKCQFAPSLTSARVALVVAVDKHLQETAEYVAQLRGSESLTTRNSSKDGAPECEQQKARHERSGVHFANKGLHVSKPIDCFELAPQRAAGSLSATKASDASRRGPSLAPFVFAMPTQRARTSPTVSLELPPSHQLSIEVDLGGPIEERGKKESDLCGVLTQSPAPALDVSASVVEFEGQDSAASAPVSVKQSLSKKMEAGRTFDEPEDANIHNLAHICSGAMPASRSHRLYFSVLSFVTAYLGFTLVSTIIRMLWLPYLTGFFREDAAPRIARAREGIGTRAWNDLHRRGRATTH